MAIILHFVSHFKAHYVKLVEARSILSSTKM